MKRQKIQRELMKLEQENMEKREEIIIKKEVWYFYNKYVLVTNINIDIDVRNQSLLHPKF